MELTTTSRADEVWTALNHGFSGDAATCNGILSAISRNRAGRSENPFRYWIGQKNRKVSALAMYSGTTGRLDVTPMTSAEAVALAETVQRDLSSLVGVLGHAGTAGSFAGRWTELVDVGARPTDGGRVLEVEELMPPDVVPDGHVRPATEDDLEVLIAWNAGFAADTDVAPPTDPDAHLRTHIGAGTVWIWQGQERPEAMSMRTDAVMGARRLAHVYTPPEQRGQGLAAALVAHLSKVTLAAGDRCMLHTQLSNPGSNRVYRRLGFRAISESTFYEFSA